MRVLPALVILPGLLCLPSAVAHAEMDRAACRSFADLEEGVAGNLRRHVQIVEKAPKPAPLEFSTRPDLREKAQRLADAHAAYLASARNYLAATEDLAHQYRLCAR